MENTANFLVRGNGESLAYHKVDGRTPGVIFLPGFMSDMTGTKATTLEAACLRGGRAFLRFDYQGHGQSSGAFAEGTIGIWAEDAVAMLDELCDGPQILVGSSMGGWIMLLVALARPDRVAGLIGIAAAPDFTENGLKSQLTDAQLQEIDREGLVRIPSDYGDEPYIITQALIEDGRQNLLLPRTILIDCPVRLLQGLRDDAVPWQTALEIQEKLRSSDVEVTLVKSGDHRLSEAVDLIRLTDVLAQLAAQIE